MNQRINESANGWRRLRRWMLLAFIHSLIQTSLIADDIFFPLANFTSGSVTNRKVLLTPLSLFPATNQVAVYDPQMLTSTTNGTITVSNMISGLYRADIQAPPKLAGFYFFVATNGTGGPLVWANTIQRAVPESVKTPQDYGYTAQASDARYLPASGITSLSTNLIIPGSQIQNSTLNSNKFDPNTLALVSRGADSNLVKFIVAQNAGQPEATIFANGTYTLNGTNYPITSVASAGILDVLAKVPPLNWPATNVPRGVKIKFGPGIFYTTTNISIQCSNTAYQVTLEGQGVNATALVYAGPATQECLTIGHPNANNSLIFQMRDLTIGGNVNFTTNVVHLMGYNDPAGPGVGGGIAQAVFERCFFCYWNSMTNADRFGPDGASDGSLKHNLIGLNIDCNFDNWVVVRDCEFAYCAAAVSLSGDHVIFENNMIGSCGNGQHAPFTNDWPQGSIYTSQAGVVCKQPGNGLLTQNGNTWKIRNNCFINTPVHYASLFYTDGAGDIGSGPGDRYMAVNSFTVYDDSDENGNYLAVTSGNPVRFINPRRDHSSTPTIMLPSLLFTNSTDFRITSTVAAPTNLVEISDIITHTNTGPWGWAGKLTTSSGLDVRSNDVVVISASSNGVVTAGTFYSIGPSNHFGGNLFVNTNVFGSSYAIDLFRGIITANNAPTLPLVDLQNRQLQDGAGVVSLDWGNYQLQFPTTGEAFVDWANGYLQNDSGQVVFDVNNYNLLLERIYDSSSLMSVDVLGRTAVSPSGKVLADWSGPSFRSTLTTNTALNSVLLQTNAAFAFRGFQNFSPTAYSQCVMWVTNTIGSAIVMTPPPGCITNGLWNCTNLTRINWEIYGSRFTNAYSQPMK